MVFERVEICFRKVVRFLAVGIGIISVVLSFFMGIQRFTEEWGYVLDIPGELNFIQIVKIEVFSWEVNFS